MEPKTYTLATLSQILSAVIARRAPGKTYEDALPQYELRVDGLWLTTESFCLDGEELANVQWLPHGDLDRPALPVPFTAYDLAAFYLDGGGYFVRCCFDNGESVDEDASKNLGNNSGKASEVLREAHRLWLLADDKFGRDDDGVRQSADWLLNDAYRETVAAMVPTAQVEPAPAVLVAEPDVVAAPIDHKELVSAPPPLTTGDIASAFDGLKWTEAKWKKPLGDKPNWLKACVVISGKRGSIETRWNPVLIAAALISQEAEKPHRVRAKFQTNHLLQPWLDSWKTYEADFIDTP
jgi:hypothetical protein